MIEERYVITNGYDSFIDLIIDVEERNVMIVQESGDIGDCSLLRKEVAEEHLRNLQSGGKGKFWFYDMSENLDVDNLRVVKVTLKVDVEFE